MVQGCEEGGGGGGGKEGQGQGEEVGLGARGF